ncbi:MAG: NapC/NirT family cytochrome c [Candidatus Margulisiibacteriota bacterium]
MRFSGIPEKIGIHLSPKFYKIAVRTLIAAFILLIVSVIAISKYSMSPSFCNSCHIMKPYYNAWASSKHNFVPCVDCHYPPSGPKTFMWKRFQALSQVAKYVTRTYSSKPFAEIEDASCLREGCHSTRLLQGRVMTGKGVKFDHRPHLEGVRYGKKLRCVSCHSQIVVGKHIEVTYNTCFLCHFKGSKSNKKQKPSGKCLTCHTLPDRQINAGNIKYNHKDFLTRHNVSCESCHQDAINGKGEVLKERCLTCHNQPEKISRYKETDFIHENHVANHNIACIHCHEEIKHEAVAAGTKSLAYDCSMCHSDTHDIQKNIYTGSGARGVPSMPSPMYLANVDCVGCHTEKISYGGVTAAKTIKGSQGSCIKCHGSSYLGIFDEAHKLAKETIAKLEEKLLKIKQAALPDSSEKQNRQINEVSYNLKFLESARSIHNIYYAASIMRDADNKLSDIGKDLKVETEDLSGLPVISGGFCATLCHAKIGVKVPPETVKYKGKTMPHKRHFMRGIACVECHTFGTHKSVKLKSPAICGQCH